MDHPPSIESILESFCNQKITEANSISPRYSELWHEIKQYLMSGGKRMRPQLVMQAYAAYGGSDTENILRVAAAWELIHACVLVHDDIIDRDTIRHGHPNIAGKYQSIYGSLGSSDTDHYALSAALIGGDLLLMSAYEMIGSATVTESQRATAYAYINKAIFVVAGGELIDTDSVLYPINETDPITIATHKTASYSLQLPLQCGAALAGASDEELEKLAEIGLHTGIAYQLKDDLLGVYGDSQVTGKSNRSDILEKKRTFLVVEALKNLDAGQSARLSNFLAPHYTVDDTSAEEIVELLTNSGAKEITELAIDELSDKALGVIKNLAIDENHKQTFSSLVAKLTTRTS